MQNNYLPIRQAVKLVLGNCPDRSTIRRWVGPGVRGRRLSCLMVGGRRMARVCDVEAFFAQPACEQQRRVSVSSAQRSELNALLRVD
jgi:hypothetical protein